MIHNPTFKPAPIEEVKKKKRVTPPVKKKIEAMLADGASADVIAKELELTIEQVEKHL
jgi:DNA-binding NarL/FixJ family response regulator